MIDKTTPDGEVLRQFREAVDAGEFDSASLVGDQRLLDKPYILHCPIAPFGMGRLLIATAESQSWFGKARTHPPLDLMLSLNTVMEGDTVWDVGCNIGVYAIPLGLAAGRGELLLIDPWRHHTWIAEANCRMNGIANVRSWTVGAWDSDGETMADAESQECGKAGGARVLLRRLEHAPRPQFIKLDVEGAEYQALAGMGDLESLRGMYFEFHPDRIQDHGRTFRDVLEVLPRLQWYVPGPQGLEQWQGEESVYLYGLTGPPTLSVEG